MSLVKEFVITEISAAPDGSPFILVTLKDPSDVKGPQRRVNDPSIRFLKTGQYFVKAEISGMSRLE